MAKQSSKYFSKKIRRLWHSTKKFHRNQDGTLALEFGILGIPFFILMFAVLETALVFFAEINITHATSETARKIRTQQDNIKTIGDFIDDVCNQVAFFPECKGTLKAEVKVFNDFASVNKTEPIENDELKNNFAFDLGEPGSVITVRTFAEWDLFASLPNIGLSNMSNGNRLIEGYAVFRNEGQLVAPQGGNGGN